MPQSYCHCQTILIKPSCLDIVFKEFRYLVQAKITIGKYAASFMKLHKSVGLSKTEWIFFKKNSKKIAPRRYQRQPSSGVFLGKYTANLQEKTHFGIGVLLYICCIFSEHLFLRTPLEGCFGDILKGITWMRSSQNEPLEVNCKEGGVVKSFVIFTGKHLGVSL